MDKLLKVKGMHCKSCEILLKDSLSEIKGVSNINVDAKKGEVKVTLENDSLLNEVKKVVQKEGYTVG